MKLSLIICVYNTAHSLLTECLESLFSEVGSENFEVIFIDDGSTIDYSETIARYPIKYEKIENRGHLGARLHGISVASGDYVAFVDSDDSVSKNYHAPMLDAARKHGADIVINGWAFHTERTKRICTKDTTMSTSIDVSGDACLRTLTSQRGREHSYYVLWNKIYETGLLKEAARELTTMLSAGEKITYGEDSLLNFLCYKRAKRIKNVSSGLYFYRIHSVQSVIADTKEKLANQIDCMSRVFRIMKAEAAKNAYSDEIEADVCEWAALMSRTHYSKAKALRLRELYPVIKDSYGVQALHAPTFKDGRCYSKSELLGENFSDVDEALTALYYREKPTEIKYERKSLYVGRIISYAREVGGDIIYSNKAKNSIPKRKISLRDKIIHSPLLYRIGLILFKKGSRLRAFLKKHL